MRVVSWVLAAQVARCHQRRLGENQHCLSFCEKDSVSYASGQEPDSGIGRPLVRLEVQGQVAMGGRDSSIVSHRAIASNVTATEARRFIR